MSRDRREARAEERERRRFGNGIERQGIHTPTPHSRVVTTLYEWVPGDVVTHLRYFEAERGS
jgi:hypothetical protein